ncbi:unknown protein [Parachlamydia acanthamoebae UV-7]|uniref:Uncharacterized protein n=1 Tax=Parachlamydia acanthamoebae (strain UV7) TaxID=765952 RepID=F8KZI9_PARAV|nr:unknown protein [Parachlamydia acanthamoebae UV-7]
MDISIAWYFLLNSDDYQEKNALGKHKFK